ncbi:MBL fold metallo-hydrolase [Jannaschia sp. Os4]|uniref:MBL fold metallo-hydrolase n=1 Tax=Jannaschia sp. Os4 TaxID=2807617 RepID=UPI0019393D43|nr:MBL fold metallo-hydrolase [Jannaschia sp. Os4]MBM2577519.1 MBL fold metallo-hydrolase [Jannaschia sp. Os4]
MTLRFTILGCGSSGGVPRLGGPDGHGGWGACDPAEPRNRRSRCAMLIERDGAEGTTRVLIDTGPDLRAQLLKAGVGALDGVVWTHAHADHVHGIDDLRMIVIAMRRRLPGWCDDATFGQLVHRFAYIFETPEGSSYPPLIERRPIEGDVVVEGAGGPITLTPVPVHHGEIDALGFRVGGLAYIPDFHDVPTASLPLLEGLDVWILDALRRAPHPSHLNLEQALGWIERVAPRRAVLTDLHNDLDYATLSAETPAHVEVAYDGMTVTLD